MAIENNKAIIDFYNAEDGLMLKGDKIHELYVADKDSIFYPDAKIQNNKLIVSSKNVEIPGLI